MKTHMTDWEVEWMEAAPQDCLRTFELNPDAPGGWSEYGETMLDLLSTESLNDDEGQLTLSLIKVDAEAPLPYGTFIRMYLFGSISNGVPVWEFEENGEPKNFRNYVITDGNSRWFERHPTGHVQRFRHDYHCEEILACLKDYPIRSVKTFAEGAYTFGGCLDIAFKLAFRPRSVGNYRYVIKPFPGLDEPNSKLEYPNSTLYDVVTDIGRIIDAVPSMELTFENGVYTFELRFIDRYGLEGEVHDISYFNDKIHDGTNIERDTSAGACISNAQNLITGENHTSYQAPNKTNKTDDWNVYQLPYPIDTVKEVRFWWEQELELWGAHPSDAKIKAIIETTGEQVYLQPYAGTPGSGQGFSFRTTGQLADRQTVLTQGEDQYVTMYRNRSSATNAPIDPIRIYLRPDDEYKYLPASGFSDSPCQDNTVHYARGGNEIHLDCIFDKMLRWFKFEDNSSSYKYGIFRFTKKPQSGNDLKAPAVNYLDMPWTVSITFTAMLNGVIKGVNSKTSDFTAFFNQQGQVIDIQSFGTAVTNYTKSMYGESRVRVHTYDRIGRREMYAEMPKVGSSVIDKERGKRYVITSTSFTRRMNGGELLATLAESRAGKSRFIIADNRQRCYAIPSDNVVDSMSHTHIICKMGLQSPFKGESNATVIEKPYLFNAFIGTPHGLETQPNKVDLQISTSDEIKSVSTDTFLSRIRLSAILSFRMLSNSAVKVENGDAELYTDENGQLRSIDFSYMAGNNKAVGFSQVLDKDAYEILNHTAQTSWVEFGNLRIHENLIDMSFFGNGEGLNEPLQLVLLSSRMRLNDPLSEHMAARYAVTYEDSGTEHVFTASGLADIPAHVGWAIARGDKVILLDNFDVLTDNVIKVFYQIEVRD